MKSFVYELKTESKEVNLLATYCFDSKKAMVSFIKEQEGDFNTCNYPNIIEGMRESKIKKHGWLFDDLKNERTLVSFEE